MTIWWPTLLCEKFNPPKDCLPLPPHILHSHSSNATSTKEFEFKTTISHVHPGMINRFGVYELGIDIINLIVQSHTLLCK
jgi:hypothetical protein